MPRGSQKARAAQRRRQEAAAQVDRQSWRRPGLSEGCSPSARLRPAAQAEVARRCARRWLHQQARRASRAPRRLADVLRARARPARFTAVRRAAVAPLTQACRSCSLNCCS